MKRALPRSRQMISAPGCSANQPKKPRPDLAARLEREVKARWQPQIRAQARQKAATTDGLVIDTRGPHGVHGADRVDGPGPRPAPDRRPAACLFDAREAGASEQELKEIAPEALKEVYLQDNGRRACQLEEARFTDIEHLEFDL
ncbi:telomere-protecting terminal protein Tpg [Streptomyces sp. NPDC001507]|uniref:telomere-protecting terminal protein Tpg n=1 Tax=Streptomyces sp. NPDC001507 TaxID=3364579 RepID=UPI0036CD1D8F